METDRTYLIWAALSVVLLLPGKATPDVCGTKLARSRVGLAVPELSPNASAGDRDDECVQPSPNIYESMTAATRGLSASNPHDAG